jgi:hypothetical protein
MKLKQTIPVILITALVTSMGTTLGAVIVNKWSPWLFTYLKGDSILIIRVVGNKQPINGVKFSLDKLPDSARPLWSGTTDNEGYAFLYPGTGSFLLRVILCKGPTDPGVEYSKSLEVKELPLTMTLDVQTDFLQQEQPACVPSSSGPKAEIRNPQVTNNKGYMVARLDEQSAAYIDRSSYIFTSVPPSLLGQSYIVTANSDKCPENPSAFSLRFDVSQPSSVFIAHDDRYARKPAWMATFEKVATGINLTVPGANFRYSLYRKEFPQGTIMLGSNIDGTCQGEGDFAMYSVIVAPKGVKVGAAP